MRPRPITVKCNHVSGALCGPCFDNAITQAVAAERERCRNLAMRQTCGEVACRHRECCMASLIAASISSDDK